MESLSDDMYIVKNLRRNMDILDVALFGSIWTISL